MFKNNTGYCHIDGTGKYSYQRTHIYGKQKAVTLDMIQAFCEVDIPEDSLDEPFIVDYYGVAPEFGSYHSRIIDEGTWWCYAPDGYKP